MSEDIAEICTFFQQEITEPDWRLSNLEDNSAEVVKEKNSIQSFKESFLGKKNELSIWRMDPSETTYLNVKFPRKRIS